VRDLPADWCTVRAKGTAPQNNFNPGGVRTMCGSDLQSWLDGVLQTPLVTFRVQMAKRDTALLGADRNRNDGANPRLSLMGRKGVGRQVIAVEFDQELIQRFLDDGPLGRATLILTIAENEGHWGRRGQAVTARPLGDTFWEGNGNLAAGERGSGRGATWNCAIDSDIADDVKTCEAAWSAPIWRGKGVAWPHDDGLLGEATWDVTEDVADGITAWTIRKSARRRGGNVLYYSREGARALLDTGLAPTLLLEH
jgi:hypothetical protein